VGLWKYPGLFFEKRTGVAHSMNPNEKPIVLYFGKYKGIPLPKVPLWYLAYVYGSYTKTRKQVEGEMGRRGLGANDFLLVMKRYPVKGKFPTRQHSSGDYRNKP
jgi:hypothetical protein